MKNTHEERAYNVRFSKYDIEGRDCIISTKTTGDARLGGVYKDSIARAINALLSGNICSDKMINDIWEAANELHLDFTYNLDPDIFGAILFNFDDCKGEDFSKYTFILNIAKCVDDPEDSTSKVINAVCRHYEQHNKIKSKVEELYENALESITKELDSTAKEYEDALLSKDSYSISTKLSPVDISDYIGHWGIRIRDHFSKQVARKLAMEIRERTGYGAYAHAITTLNTNKVDEYNEYGIFIFPIRKRRQAMKIREELAHRFIFPNGCCCEVLKAGELYGV